MSTSRAGPGGPETPDLPPAHGQALAREIPGGRLLIIDELGHEFPPSAWDEVLPSVIAVTDQPPRP